MQDAVLDREPGALRELGAGDRAEAADEQVGVERAAVGQHHALDAPLPLHPRDRDAGVEPDAVLAVQARVDQPGLAAERA